MKITKELISSADDQNIYLVSITNDNNFSVTFSNFGGYIHQVLIPYENNPEFIKFKKEDLVFSFLR